MTPEFSSHTSVSSNPHAGLITESRLFLCVAVAECSKAGDRRPSCPGWSGLVCSRVYAPTALLKTLTKNAADFHALHLLWHQVADLCNGLKKTHSFFSFHPHKPVCLPAPVLYYNLPFQKTNKHKTHLLKPCLRVCICFTVGPYFTVGSARSRELNSYRSFLSLRNAVKPAGCSSPTTKQLSWQLSGECTKHLATLLESDPEEAPNLCNCCQKTKQENFLCVCHAKRETEEPHIKEFWLCFRFKVRSTLEEQRPPECFWLLP